MATVVQVDIDPAELSKGHPRVDLALEADADAVLEHLAASDLAGLGFDGWRSARRCATLLPVVEPSNQTAPGFVDPYQFVVDLSRRCRADDVIVPCCSGGRVHRRRCRRSPRCRARLSSPTRAWPAWATASPAHRRRAGQPDRRTVLIEGDGGFTQNLQELATVAVNRLPLKIFLFSNEGYASIRMTQRNYFDGAYLGCDTPDRTRLPGLATAVRRLRDPVARPRCQRCRRPTGSHELLRHRPGRRRSSCPSTRSRPTSRRSLPAITATGGMESQPLHLMSPRTS